jgi:hypothetical protein
LLNRNVLRVCEYKALKWAKGDEVTEEWRGIMKVLWTCIIYLILFLWFTLVEHVACMEKKYGI